MRRLPATRSLALPKTFRGCWKRPAYVRRYKAAWQAIRRQDPFFREKELAAQKDCRPSDALRMCTLPSPRRPRVRRCFFERVTRMVPGLDGRLAEREVDYCGSC